MILEAVYFKDGKEVGWIDPVLDLFCLDPMEDISEVEVYNGRGWFSSKDCDEVPDDFVIRIKKED